MTSYNFRGHIIHFYWNYVHLTSLEPIFWIFRTRCPKISPDPPPPPQKITFIEQNDFVMQQNQQDPHILDHSGCILQSPRLQKILRKAQVCFNRVWEQKYQPWTLITPSFESQWCIQSLKIIFQFHEYCARGLSKFKSCMEVLRSAYIINIVALKGS